MLCGTAPLTFISLLQAQACSMQRAQAIQTCAGTQSADTINRQLSKTGMSSAKSGSGGQKASVDRMSYHNILMVGAAGWSIPCLLSQTLRPHAIMEAPHPLPCWLMPLPWLK